MSKSNIPGCQAQLDSRSLHQQTGQDSLSGNFRPTVENHELASSIQNMTLCQIHPWVSKCDCRFTVQINSLRLILHCMFQSTCKNLFTPQVNLFGTCLDLKLPLSVSPVADQQAWKIWSGPVAYVYATTAALLKVVHKSLPVQLPYSGSLGLAGHALVLQSGTIISRNPTSVA